MVSSLSLSLSENRQRSAHCAKPSFLLFNEVVPQVLGNRLRLRLDGSDGRFLLPSSLADFLLLHHHRRRRIEEEPIFVDSGSSDSSDSRSERPNVVVVGGGCCIVDPPVPWMLGSESSPEKRGEGNSCIKEFREC
jgi:hypothetical protein